MPLKEPLKIPSPDLEKKARHLPAATLLASSDDLGWAGHPLGQSLRGVEVPLQGSLG